MKWTRISKTKKESITRVSRLRAYYYLTKPGIVRGNLFTALAGFLLASQRNIDFGLLLATLAGIGLIIASACVFNNYIDRGIDKKMARTKKRALVTGAISNTYALVYATALGIIGFGLLIVFTNTLTFLLGLLALFSYVVLYGYAKRKSVHGTLVGTLPGALPPVAGYTAVSGQLDAGAIILFFILVFWQMPHFYAIAMYRKDDYAAAGIPVHPIVRGMKATQTQILRYIVGFIAVSLLLPAFGYTGYTYTIVAIILGCGWLYFGIKNLGTGQVNWAKKMFGYSLIVLTALSITISLEAFLP